MPPSIVDRGRAVVRADASPSIGLGHVSRSLALAEELAADGWAVTMCAAGLPPGTRSCAVEVTPVEPAPEPDPATVLAFEPDLVVVDGYHFTGPFFSALEGHGVPVAIVDDDGSTPVRRPAAVINQNPDAHPAMYDHLDGDPLLLLGIDYCLLRREVALAAARTPPERSTAVLVAFGGSDPRRLTVPVAVALAATGLEVRAAVGPAHDDRERVVAALAEAGIAVVRPADYVAELASAGVAVLAAGSSLWEAAALGTPTVGVVVADNQQSPAAAAREHGLVAEVVVADGRLAEAVPRLVRSVLAESPGPPPERRPAATGARRAAAALGALARDPITLRTATAADEAFLFAVRTDPEVAAQSFGPVPTADEHRDWLTRTIGDPDRRLFVVEAGDRPIGQLRLDARPDPAARPDAQPDPDAGAETVSIALVAGERRRGRGRRMLRAAQRCATGDLVARIRTANRASIATFTAAGFSVAVSAGDAVVMRWRRGSHGDGQAADA